MSQTHSRLLDEWRAAADATRAAQQRLKDSFERHLTEGTEPPAAADIAELGRLRDAESAALRAALDYAAEFGSGPPTGGGPDGRRSTRKP